MVGSVLPAVKPGPVREIWRGLVCAKRRVGSGASVPVLLLGRYHQPTRAFRRHGFGQPVQHLFLAWEVANQFHCLHTVTCFAFNEQKSVIVVTGIHATDFKIQSKIEAPMVLWRSALLVILICTTTRESVVQLAAMVQSTLTGQSQRDEQSWPMPEAPSPLEGEEADWLSSDGEDDHHGLSYLLPEPRRLTRQVAFDAAHGGGCNARAVISALHRLRI